MAQAACLDAGHDGLALLENASQQAVIESLAEAVDTTDLIEVWFGMNDLDTEGLWTWVHGTSAYENWLPGQPGQEGDEDCGMINPSFDSSFEGYKWVDVPCDRSYWYACSAGN